MKKNWPWIILGVIILLVIAFFSVRSCKTSVKTKTTEATATLDSSADQLKTALAEIEDLKNKNQNLESKNLRLQAQLDSCCPSVKELSSEEKLKILWKERRPAPSVRPVAPPSSRKKTIIEDVPEQDFSGGGFNRSSSDFQRQTSTGSQVNTGLKMNFAGNFDPNSKYGTTTTADPFRLYYIKDSYVRANGMSIPAPRLNGTDGPEFTFDPGSGYWFFIDNRTLLSPSMINSLDYATIWCVYIGPIGTWDAFLPHESLKAEMKRVRGREDGAITMEELYRMHQSNPDIWTDRNKNGTLLPKSFNPMTGETERGTKIGREDGLIYQGWDFRTITTGTVTTDKVNGSSSYGN